VEEILLAQNDGGSMRIPVTFKIEPVMQGYNTEAYQCFSMCHCMKCREIGPKGNTFMWSIPNAGKSGYFCCEDHAREYLWPIYVLARLEGKL